MKRKAILGGTFDPIHNGHIDIAYKALKELKLDSVIFMPTGNSPHKNNTKITDAQVRYELIKLALEKEDKFILDDYEIKKQGISFTCETVRYFAEKEKETQWFFLIGSDCLLEIESWNSLDVILKYSKLAVFNRHGYRKEDVEKEKEKLEKIYYKGIIYLDGEIQDISSTDIRSMIKAGFDAKGYLPEAVYDTIKELRLYE